MDKFACSQAPELDLPRCHEKIAGILAYWRSLRPGPGVFPGRQHFDPAAVAPLLPCIRLYDVFREPWRFRYRLVGTELVRHLGRDLTGTWFGENVPDEAQSKSYRDLVFVASGKGLSYHRGYPAYTQAHKDHLSAERILLPLAKNGHDVDMILGLSVLHAAVARQVA
ncbi:MAG TPA: PAS domain-containing protein [Stellaceae bacterium]|nr:PAS domain-containing protein [Stellaceae bacterium]